VHGLGDVEGEQLEVAIGNRARAGAAPRLVVVRRKLQGEPAQARVTGPRVGVVG